MAATQGNQFWKLRSKHGRDKIFSSGEMIIAAAYEFMEALEENPLKEHDFVGKDAMEVEKNKKQVPTWSGFANFCDVHRGYFIDLKASTKEKDDEISKGISIAITRVEDIFYHDKFTAASAGLANPSLIGKELGIVEKTDVTTNGKEIKAMPTAIQVEIVRPKEDDE